MSKDINEDELNKITSPIIKGERPVYHLITEEKLNDLVSNSFAGSIYFAFFSIFEGAALKEKNWTYVIVGVLFLFVSLYFYWLKVRFIHRIKKSGEVQSFKYEPSEDRGNRLSVLKAIYGTPPDKIMDVTDALNSKIKDDKLFFQLLNSVVGGDPNVGINKTLDIEFKIGNEVISKKYKEYEYINLP